MTPLRDRTFVSVYLVVFDDVIDVANKNNKQYKQKCQEKDDERSGREQTATIYTLG